MEDITPTTDIDIVVPNVELAKKAMLQFEKIKSEILNDSDIVIIAGKKYIKRSGWRKIALAFNITTEIVKIEREVTDDKYIIRVIARAKAPNGRISEEVGISDSSEFTGNLKGTYHNIESKAVTRAINRAISNLVGGGEVTAEEIFEGPEEKIEQKSDTKIDVAYRAVLDFFDTKNMNVEVQLDKEKNEIIILSDIPNAIFNELSTVLKRYNIKYLGRKKDGGSYWMMEGN